MLDGDSFGDDVLNCLLAGTLVDVRKQKASKVGMETLVTGNELIGEGKTRHETTLLEPEDGGEGATEEDTLYSREGDEAGGEC